MPISGRSLKDTVSAAGRKLGRPRTAVPDNAVQLVREYAADGFSLIGIAAKLGTTRATLSQWMDADPALKDALDVGREDERHTLHNLLFKQATEKGNTVAALFLLKARHGYREGEQGDQANRVSINFTLPGAMRPEQFIVEHNPNDQSTATLALPTARLDRS